MRVSIVTPSFNYGRFFEEAMDSVVSQSERLQVELVIADGGSTDQTIEIVERRADPRVGILVEPDVGQSDALNKALRRATGDIVGWMNADDYYLPGAFEAVVNIFSSYPSVDVVHGDVCFVDVGSRLRRLGAGYPVDDRVLESRGCVIPSCATFVRRTALERWSFDTELRVIMDWDYFLYLRRTAGSWAYLARPLSAFRRHGDQVTAGQSDRYSSEHERVTNRYKLPARTTGTLAIGDWLHRWRKLTSGSYFREARSLRYAGQLVRWNCRELAIDPLLSIYGRALDRVTVVE